MDRHRGGGDRYGNSPNDSHPYRHTRGGGGGGPPPSRSSDDGPMMRHRGGFPGNRRPFDNSPPRYSLSGGGGGGGFHPMDGDGGFRPLGVRAARNYNGPSEFEVPLSGQKRFNPDYEVPMSGQKRQFPFPGRGGSPPDRFDEGNFEKRNFDGDNFDKRQIDVVNFDKKPAEGGSFAKLFVGSVPKTATEEDIRPVFEEHGNVVEVALIKDKRTGQQQGHTMFASAGCCFIKYATSEDADRAIRALHNQYTLPGGMGPIQVRYADGERERLGNLPSTFAPCAVEFKLFVGSLNKQATEKEVEEIFLPYGRVEDVYLMRDEMKQSRGCGFVKFSNRDVAMAAINSLNGIYIMRGCEQPLIVRFADPKRPRPGETRPTPAFGGSGFGPRMQSPGIRPPNVGEMMHGSMPPNAWHPMSQQGMGPASDIGMHGYGGGQVGPRSSDGKVLSAPGGGGHGGVGDNMYPGAAVPSTTNHQSFNPPLSQLPSGGQNQSPLKKQNQSPHLQAPTTFSQPPPSTTTTTGRPTGQLQPPPNTTTGQQPSFSQPFPSQPIPGGFNGMLPPQSNLPSATPPPSLSNNNLPPHLLTAMMNQYQMPGQQQQSASPLAQMLTQQKQTLQASYQSSQQAFSQLQQQLQLMQPSPQGGGGGRWPPQAASANPVATPGKPVAEAAVPPVMPAGGPLKCSWTEHTSPDGYKYYYNSTTGESKWEKPEELALFEQQKPQEQQQKQQTQMPSHSSQGVPHQQSQGMPHQQSQGMPHQQTHSQGVVPHQQSQIPQIQLQNHLQTQMRHPPQMQHATQSSMYPNAGVAGHQNMQGYGYAQMPVAGGSMNDSARFQQGMQGGGQEWMWKNKTGPGS